MSDDSYSRAFDILTASVQAMGEEGVTKEDLLPTLLDFTASVAVALGGEAALEALIFRIKDRIADFREGTFPVNNAELR